MTRVNRIGCDPCLAHGSRRLYQQDLSGRFRAVSSIRRVPGTARVRSTIGFHAQPTTGPLDIANPMTRNSRRPSAANGTDKRFNGRLECQIHRANNAEDLTKTLHRYVWLYNQQAAGDAQPRDIPDDLEKMTGITPPLVQQESHQLSRT
jgi:hypothetical protein